MLDEPTTGMDPMNRKHVWDLVRDAKRECTVVLTTHSMEEADALGDRISIMSGGSLVALGSSLHLKTKYGEGYRVSLVAPPSSLPRIRRSASDALGRAPIEEAAGNILFALPDAAAMARAANLFELIERLQSTSPGPGPGPGPGPSGEGSSGKGGGEGGGGQDGEDGGKGGGESGGAGVGEAPLTLTDWGVSHTTLEDVFVSLARGGDEHHKGRRARKDLFKATLSLSEADWAPGTPFTYVARDGEPHLRPTIHTFACSLPPPTCSLPLAQASSTWCRQSCCPAPRHGDRSPLGATAA